MIALHDLRIGDWVFAESDGQKLEGCVENLDGEKACITTFGDQEFWYEPEHIFPIPLSEAQLLSFGFVKTISSPPSDTAGDTFVKGPFSLSYLQKDHLDQ
ncbi:MAG: hypothetical protein ACYCOO_10820, partial [Chitinophagaceae bacterium]